MGLHWGTLAETLPPTPQPATTMDTPKVVRASSLMRRTNIRLRQLLEDPFAEPESIPFFCECRSPTCFSVIWKTAAAFEAMEASQSGWLLCDGHVASATWRPRAPDPGLFRSGAMTRLNTARARQGIGQPSASSITKVATSA
jgi:hypothetical protein